jgi:hypothetical protein
MPCVYAKHDAAKNNRVHEAEAYTAQISSIERRAEMIRRCFLLVLVSLAGTVGSCLLLGFGLYWKEAATAAVVLFVVAMICLLAGTLYYIREVTVALSSVHNEACDSRFMELEYPAGDWGRNPLCKARRRSSKQHCDFNAKDWRSFRHAPTFPQ